MIGTVFGHYTIESKLGEGGMGVVYKATDTKLNRPVALKFLPDHVSEAEKDKERFVQEAQTAASLSHANICTIFGIEEFDGKQFIVMEYVDGQTLQDKKQNLSLKQALEIGIQIADGLAAAHEKGIVHRDIKPENIMIKNDGTVQIMDFGLAKLRGATRLTKEGSTVGTVGYMSPEQVQGQDVDHRTDIFSLGVLLYEMISNQSPFKGVHETAIIYEIVHVDPPPIGTIKPEVDADLDAVVLDCLAKDPTDRYQSAAEVARNLRRLKRESSRSRVSRMTGSRTAYVLPGSASGAASSGPGTIRVSFLPWVVAGLSAVIAAAFAWLYLTGSPAPQRELRLAIPPPHGIAFGTLYGGHQAISPDGSMIVFIGIDSNRTPNLYLRVLSDPTPRKLPETLGAMYPFWSPDNRWIGFLSGPVLKKIDIMGGSPLTICDVNAFRGASWNSAGQIIYNGYGGSAGLWIISANGGESLPFNDADSSTLLNQGSSNRWPWFLPDGDHFLYSSATPAGAEGKILIGSLSGNQAKELLNVRSNAQYANGYIYFCRDNKIVAQPFDEDALEFTGDPIPVTENPTFDAGLFKADFSVSNEGTIVQSSNNSGSSVMSTSILWVDRAGKEIPGPRHKGDIVEVSLSPDGTILALTEGTAGAQDIWTYDLRRNVRSRLTFDPAPDRYPAWSPDGSTMFFTSMAEGTAQLYQKDAAGIGEAKRLLNGDPNMGDRVSDVSRDGKYLFFLRWRNGPNDDIYALPLQGERTPMPVVVNSFDNEFPSVSPDGRWVAYASNETGVFQVYVVPFPPTGSRWQITSDQEGAHEPRWTAGGREIVLNSGGMIVSVPIETRGATLLPGTPRALFESPFSRGAKKWDVSRDGKIFVGVSTGSAVRPNDPLLVVMNWSKNK